MLKVTGLKSQGIRGSFNFRVQRWVRGGKIFRVILLGADRASEGCKMGSEIMFGGFHFGVYAGIHVFIYGGKTNAKVYHFMSGLREIRGQGIEENFQVLAMYGIKRENEKGTSGTTQKMGYG
jgi:hypothetical protein